MNNYQIYDEIGKGRNSVVYKGRKKKSIEYFAIASIEKSQRQKVLTSVQFLRSLSHRNVLKFHNWYETNNHLWVITEYCIGGDLRAVLDLDQRLSENSVRVLGLDLAEGLMHIHSKGVVYGDLKPSNILMDATASLRFYDFALSCTFENAENATKVGTPSYMAPELFRDGGAPSMASDLWSFGCVLYEMASGKPPFVAGTIQGLIQKIVNEPHKRLENCTPAFNDLIETLLTKDPLERATWQDIAANDTWQGKLSPVPSFPPQPAFDKFKRQAMEMKRPMSKEVEKRNKDILRASVNAERNLARELAKDKGASYNSQQVSESNMLGGVLHIDREVDFSENGAAAEANDGSAPPSGPGIEAPAPTMSNFSQETHNGEVVFSSSRKQQDNNELGPTAAQQADGGLLERVNLDEILHHTSDAHIRPLVTNTRIEKFVEQKFEPASLGFPAMSLTALKQLSSKDLEGFLTSVYKVLSSNADAADKLNALCYFETLCSDAAIANVVINSSVMTLCVKLISKPSNSANFRSTTASIMGLLVRHATFIHSDLAKSNIVGVLTQALQEEQQVKTYRKLLACLGELLFYIGTQSPEERSLWSMDAGPIRAVYLRALQHEDDVIKHYAVKAIENLSSTSDRTVVQLIFTRKEFVELLLWIHSLPVALPARTEHLKSSAVCAALKLCFASADLFPHVAFSPLFPIATFSETLASSNAKVVQILITFINVFLCKAAVCLCPQEVARRCLIPATGSELTATEIPAETMGIMVRIMLQGNNSDAPAHFVGGLCAVLEHATPVVRAKGLTTLTLLCMFNGGAWLGEAEGKIFAQCDKLVKDKDPYVQKCVSPMISGLRHFVCLSAESVASGSLSVTPHTFKAALNVLTSNSIRQLLNVPESFLRSLAACVATISSYQSNAVLSPYEETVHYMVEAIAMDNQVRAQHSLTIASCVVVPYGQLLSHPDSGRRFAAVQMILSLLYPIVQDATLFNTSASVCPVVTSINEFMASIVPCIAQLLEDAEPTPLYTLKLLSVCCERSPTVTMHLLMQSFVEKLLVFLDPDHPSNSVYVVQILLRVLQCGGDEMILFAAQRSMVPKLLATMHRSIDDASLESYTDPCFEIVFFFLCSAVNDATSVVAQQASHFIVNRELETVFFPRCAMKQGAPSECAASSIFLLTQLFSEARSAMLQPTTLSTLREIFSSVDEGSVHTVLPLVRALILCATAAKSPSEIRALQQDEPLLVFLQAMAESAIDDELASQTSELLQLLYGRAR